MQSWRQSPSAIIHGACESTTRITSASASQTLGSAPASRGLSALRVTSVPQYSTRGIAHSRTRLSRRAKPSAVRAPRWAKMTGCLAQAIASAGAGDIFPDWRIADRLLRRASLQRGPHRRQRFRTVAHAVSSGRPALSAGSWRSPRPGQHARRSDRPAAVQNPTSRISAAWSRISWP
ncbi:Uncharacterised protein [Klebsiella pneumoniae]|uniref:Uncharacterized protein n=1 Tax=Klebsiella pneumoniae TaxID=573 RepID=A0A377XNE6_KLEPN|nr:Uncharacterised protein [Klebsiella pneumoniae]